MSRAPAPSLAMVCLKPPIIPYRKELVTCFPKFVDPQLVTLLYTSGSSWILVLTTSTGVRAPWVMAQPKAPARANLERRISAVCTFPLVLRCAHRE